MLVIDLIIKLQQLNPNLKVMVDITKAGGVFFNRSLETSMEKF